MSSLFLSTSDPNWLSTARRVVEDSGLVIFPTDTVYGIGCRVDDPAAIERLYLIKGRPAQKAIPVLIGEVAQIEKVCGALPGNVYPLIERFWPGALTIVLPRNPTLPAALGPLATVGVRMPDHPVALALLREAGPLAASSANLSGTVEAHRAHEARDQLGDHVELILDGGETPGGVPSTVVDLTQPDFPILRAGPISADSIHSLL
jgi:L-threonylcarbamoyladenylate synthase